MVEVAANCLLEFARGAMGATTDLFFGERCEPAFDLVARKPRWV